MDSSPQSRCVQRPKTEAQSLEPSRPSWCFPLLFFSFPSFFSRVGQAHFGPQHLLPRPVLSFFLFPSFFPLGRSILLFSLASSVPFFSQPSSPLLALIIMCLSREAITGAPTFLLLFPHQSRPGEAEAEHHSRLFISPP